MSSSLMQVMIAFLIDFTETYHIISVCRRLLDFRPRSTIMSPFIPQSAFDAIIFFLFFIFGQFSITANGWAVTRLWQ